MKPGRFISLEGGEGAGKSTQIRLLSGWLDEQKIAHVCTREPGGTPGAEEIRNLLVRGEASRWTPKTEALLMFAARQEHTEKVIRPALARGEWVLCDRYADSSVAYQGYGHELGAETVRELQHWVLGDFQPDLTLLLDLPVEQGLARGLGNAVGENRFEGMDIAFHERMREGFLEIARCEPERCTVIDATQDEPSVAADIRAALKARFGAELDG